ncbi:YicC/YloC family endoribonuclease [Candidatus Ishikawella capsulata]|uniref:YicC family protein n=1 Tax=Candidatus Ishikawaella capsulata Mpkobe TaxID=476281 RepID=C5WDS5_9ENTR|nr:YicC/YloC family endoribonuclease [Candidatus Ishikawaella capsulata]BAH83481.1 hypothetical protein ICMP_653 [Candidatus Ishikawaella capsulata Mpkobe]
MIRSMTSYTYREFNISYGRGAWELRSVNKRYLEITVYLPKQFRVLEPIIRENISNYITRGKIECSLYFNGDINTTYKLFLNESLAAQLIQAANKIKLQSNQGIINPIDILSWPNVISCQETNFKNIYPELLKILADTLKEFIIVREKEGIELKKFIQQRLVAIMKEVQKIRRIIPEIKTWQRKRLMTTLKQIEIKIENKRIEQELVMLAQRNDITEELDRLDVHLKQTVNILNNKGPMGRRLDFMMQEFNRESNTLASKSVNIDVISAAIELKVLIEQIREQIQNIE